MKFWMVGLAGFMLFAGCVAFQQKPDGGAPPVADLVNSVAPLLPPPFGILAGGLATLLTGVASVGANKVSNEKFKKKEQAPLLVRLVTDHASSILAAALPSIIALRASGAIHFSDAELMLLTTTFGAPVATKKVMRRPQK